MNMQRSDAEMATDFRTKKPIGLFGKVMLFVGILAGLMLVGLFIMSTFSIDQLQQARQGLRAFGEWWMYVRWTFIAGLFIYWIEINTWIAQRNGWTEAHLRRVLDGRWLTLGVLLFVELFFVLRIHEPFVDRWLS